MPKFKFSFERTYSITEGFERVIEAPSFAEAEAAAANLAVEFNHDCPDDCSEIESGDTQIGNFEATSSPAIRDTAEAADYVVQPDGQVFAADEALPCQHCGEPRTSNPCEHCNGFNE
jgi:hypothetical protein